jgi:hypothetical protein
VSELQPIETAPKDQILLSYWGNDPVFICWWPSTEKQMNIPRGVWPFKKYEHKTEGDPAGWRVMSWSPRLGWGVLGNCAPFTPDWWAPLPVEHYVRFHSEAA